LQWLDTLAQNLDYQALSDALAKVLSWPNYGGHSELNDSKNRMSLLAHFIYLHRFQTSQAYTSHKHFVHVISVLLSSVADDMNLDELQRAEYGQNKLGSTQGNGTSVSDLFVREQILSLVNQESIGNLLSGARDTKVSPEGAAGLDEEAKQLASYALTLLRFFPRRGDEIRMWLYLSSTPASSTSGDRIPTIKYFWQAARSSNIFNTISRDSRAAIRLLKPRNSSSQFSWEPPNSEKGKSESIQDEWRVILVFLELYTFILKLMDDEEFFSASPVTIIANGASSTRPGYKALPLQDVQELTTFLKNLGFTMYFNAAEIADMGERESNIGSISSYFHVSSESHYSEVTSEGEKPGEITVAGLSGMSIDYVKGLVTGLLRMLYERDSRRKFLPKDHWLMTSHFDMDSFIPVVVAEEENRHKVQEEDDADVDEFEEEVPHLIGTTRDQRIRNNERLRRQQRRASRKRYLQAVAPRLEILQNMPFFIPFETRVQIFRDFVRLDQVRTTSFPNLNAC
jgi:ubiquitin-protein ligase E3 C